MPRLTFFDLPRELRDEVIYLATGRGFTLKIELLYRYGKCMVRRQAPRPDTTLLRVSQRFHQEAAEAIYGQNQFIIDCPTTFLDMIGPANASYLRHAQLHLTDLSLYPFGHENPAVMPKCIRKQIREAIITRCTGLTTLEITVPSEESSYYTRSFPESVLSIEEVAGALPSLNKRVLIMPLPEPADEARLFRPQLKLKEMFGPVKELGWIIRRVDPNDSSKVEDNYDFEKAAEDGAQHQQ